MATANYQYIQPVVPSHWNSEEKRYANMVLDVLDTIFSWKGRLTATDLSEKGKQQLTEIVGKNVELDAAQIKNLKAEVATITKAYLSSAEIDWAKIDRLTATIAQITSASIKSAQIDSAQITDLVAKVAEIVEANIGTMNVDWAKIESLTAAVANIAKAQIGTADIDWGHIKDLVTGKAIITQGQAGELYIADLAVTEANMVKLTLGQLLLKGADGGYYTVSVDGEGNLSAVRTDVTEAMPDGTLSGDKLIEGSVTATKLNVKDIFADNASIRDLIAANVNVDVLFAREATINAINAMDIMANDRLKIFVDGQNALNEQLKAWFNFSKDGVLGIGRSDTAFSTTISFEELAFWYYSTKVAYMRGDEMHVPNAVIDTRLRIGDLSGEVAGDYVVWS